MVEPAQRAFVAQPDVNACIRFQLERRSGTLRQLGWSDVLAFVPPGNREAAGYSSWLDDAVESFDAHVYSV